MCIYPRGIHKQVIYLLANRYRCEKDKIKNILSIKHEWN